MLRYTTDTDLNWIYYQPHEEVEKLLCFLPSKALHLHGCQGSDDNLLRLKIKIENLSKLELQTKVREDFTITDERAFTLQTLGLRKLC